jgi:hypothetical protein
MSKDENTIPEEFQKVARDFISDIKTTFPEFTPLIHKWWKPRSDFEHIENEEERENLYSNAENTSITFLFKFCQKKYPPRFFEILYENEEIFKEESDVDTEFLPHIHFKNLWHFDISTKTKETIWKYLQLILFTVVGTIDSKDAFGDTAKLFEAINQDDFKNKLEEAFGEMQKLFDENKEKTSDGEEGENINIDSNSSSDKMPNMQDIHEHLSGILDGKIGKLAKEIAEETANDLNMEMDDVTSVNDIFSKLIKNPTKLMGIVKNMGDKLDSRIKSGEIKESELMAEATEIMHKMKNMPGMGNIHSMLNKMGMPIPGGGKVNMGAMEAQLNRNMKQAKMRERMKAKAQAQQANRTSTPSQQVDSNIQQPAITEEQLLSLFSKGEKPERTPRQAKPTVDVKTKKEKGKNKNK